MRTITVFGKIGIKPVQRLSKNASAVMERPRISDGPGLYRQTERQFGVGCPFPKVMASDVFGFRIASTSDGFLIHRVRRTGIAYFNYPGGSEVATTYKSMIQGLTEISVKAVGDHKDCALEELPRWEAVSGTDYPRKAVFTEKVLMPLKSKFSDNVEMLNAHDCVYDGKLFTHVVLKDGARTVSVFIDNSGEIPVGESADETITTDSNQGFQVASFHNKTQAVFVVSDLPETENIRIARTLSAVFSV